MFAWIAFTFCRHEQLTTTRLSGTGMLQMKSPRYSRIPWRQYIGRPSCATSQYSSPTLFAYPDSKQSKPLGIQSSPIESSLSTGAGNNVNPPGTALEHDARHWFTQLLPEGWCVGVCTPHSVDSTSTGGQEESAMSSTTLLHPNEYYWGQNNIESDASRTSYYLGRVALRLSIKKLLQRYGGATMSSISGDTAHDNGNENIITSFYTQLFDQIQSTAIMKDYHGRPILPEIITGSISHKGEYAVGLARFRSSSWNSPSRIIEDLKIDNLKASEASTVEWREECPIVEDDENADNDGYGDKISHSPISPSVCGVGVDLEQINAKRGKRIKRKVLTESENKELGRLKNIGISSGEEAILRFSLKESVYKAMHPILCQYVGFQEAEVTPLHNGTAKVRLNLSSGAHQNMGIIVQSASWKMVDRFFLTSASVGIKLPGDT